MLCKGDEKNFVLFIDETPVLRRPLPPTSRVFYL